MHHFGVELHAIELAGVVGDGGEGRAVGHRDGAEAVGELGDAVAMAHPYRRPVARAPDAMEQRRIAGDLKFSAAEFAVVSAFDLAAEGGNHGRSREHMPRTGTPELTTAGETAARRSHAPMPARRRGPPPLKDRLERRLGLVEGHDFRITPASRTRRAMSWVYWAPKSTMSTLSGWSVMALVSE